MFFLVLATDKRNALPVRLATKAAHMAHLDRERPDVKVLQTGPWTDSDGNEAGSVLVLQATSPVAVEAFMREDPYSQADLFDSVEIKPWKWRRGNPYVAGAATAAAPTGPRD